jgi:hypothetical protein
VVVLAGWLAGASVVVASGWSIQPTRNPVGATEGDLQAVSCASPTSCIAVGGPLAESWDGTRWSTQRAGGLNDALLSVSCVSSAACIAVGSSYPAGGTWFAGVERWDGTRWSAQPISPPAGATSSSLSAVSCVSSSDCTAVGSSWFDSGTSALVERWNGTSWSIEPTPDTGSTRSSLSGVSCPAPGSCTAVGSYNNALGAGTALVEHWDGSSWSIEPVPNLAGAGSSDLTAVSCSAPNACTAVGLEIASPTEPLPPAVPLVERWDGSSWSIQQSPDPGDQATLQSVSCSTARACTAVGFFYPSDYQQQVVERWDGTGWSVETTRNPAGSTDTSLAGVSCTAPTQCTGVGDYYTRAGNSLALVEGWGGAKWSTEPTLSRNGSLTSVSCASASACVAIGSHQNASGYPLPLVERWHGQRWSIQTTPRPAGAIGSSLNDVSCDSPKACTAVGNYYDGSGQELGLVERWNGRGWSIQPTHNPTGVTSSHLNGVSCTSPTSCTAVGGYSAGFILGTHFPAGGTLVERWNGRRWSIQHTPFSGASLMSVSCASARACTAVGGFPGAPTDAPPSAIAERWNGKRWSIQPTPRPVGIILNDVSCSSPTKCTAVSTSGTVERWNGQRWSVQNAAGTSTPNHAELSGVSCPQHRQGATKKRRSGPSRRTECIAVGSGNTLAERWNGKRWSVQPTPNPTGVYLSHVSCWSTRACTAVGTYNNQAGQTLTLVERWNQSR